jgi:hypothetical protein
MSNGLSGGRAPIVKEHLMRAIEIRAAIRIAAAA